MVHYIRYLRTPQIKDAPKKSSDLSAVVAVTTDLGDAFLAYNVTLHARIIDAAKSGEILCTVEAEWQAHSRAVRINLNVPPKFANRLVAMHITTRETITALHCGKTPDVVDIWSSTFNLKSQTKVEPLVERRLQLLGRPAARMWEETGDSIARHIWCVVSPALVIPSANEHRDASLGCIMYFNTCFDPSQTSSLPRLQKLLTNNMAQRLRILEVGAGCGLVGIALSQMRKCEVVLTDLKDAQDIMQTNIDSAVPASGSSLVRQVLEWGNGLNSGDNARFDLVLVSDCIYNPDSSVLLARTLQEIAKHSPNLLVFIAFKRRHDADEIFFEHMEKTSLQLSEHARIILPHIMTEQDENEPYIETYLYS